MQVSTNFLTSPKLDIYVIIIYDYVTEKPLTHWHGLVWVP